MVETVNPEEFSTQQKKRRRDLSSRKSAAAALHKLKARSVSFSVVSKTLPIYRFHMETSPRELHRANSSRSSDASTRASLSFFRCFALRKESLSLCQSAARSSVFLRFLIQFPVILASLLFFWRIGMPAEDFANASRLSQVLARTAFLLCAWDSAAPVIFNADWQAKTPTWNAKRKFASLDTGNALSPLPLALSYNQCFPGRRAIRPPRPSLGPRRR